MQLILYTPPYFHKDEINVLEKAMELGVYRIHIRKKKKDDDLISFLHKIPKQWFDKMSIHYHHTLLEAFPFSGFHFSKEQQEVYLSDNKKWHFKNELRSTSFHEQALLLKHKDSFDYVFGSPIFSSISKKDHHPFSEWDFSIQENKNHQTPIFALGGIDVDKIPICKEKGFDGIAILGTIWQQKTTQESINELKRIKKICDQLS